MSQEILTVLIPAVLTLVGIIYVQRNTRRVNEKASEVEKGRAEDLKEVEIIKVKTEGDVKRTDALLETQMQFIKDLQAENRQQRQEMLENNKLHRQEMLQMRDHLARVEGELAECILARKTIGSEVTDLRGVVDELLTNYSKPTTAA